jgi:hypothetical protein
MPLLPGKENIGKNISELENSSTQRPRKQVIAIALSEARRTGSDIPFPKKLHTPKVKQHKK